MLLFFFFSFSLVPSVSAKRDRAEGERLNGLAMAGGSPEAYYHAAGLLYRRLCDRGDDVPNSPEVQGPLRTAVQRQLAAGRGGGSGSACGYGLRLRPPGSSSA